MTRRCLAAFLPLLACLLWAPDLAASPTPREDRPLQVWATTADRRLALAPLPADAAIDPAAPPSRPPKRRLTLRSISSRSGGP